MPARIIMNSLRGPWSISVPMGHEPEHMPHCMHMLILSPPRTLSRTQRAKFRSYLRSAWAGGAAVIFPAP